MENLDGLITDRDNADLERARDLAEKGVENMTAAELQEYLAGLKGAYNVSDLNRVEEALKYLTTRLKLAGFYIELNTKTDWRNDMLPPPAEFERYLQNVRKIRDVLPAGSDMPAVPESMENLQIYEANDIEQILLNIEQIITNISKAWYYSGETYAGEV